jgi:hypothetical protein
MSVRYVWSSAAAILYDVPQGERRSGGISHLAGLCPPGGLTQGILCAVRLSRRVRVIGLLSLRADATGWLPDQAWLCPNLPMGQGREGSRLNLPMGRDPFYLSRSSPSSSGPTTARSHEAADSQGPLVIVHITPVATRVMSQFFWGPWETGIERKEPKSSASP